MNNKFFVLIFVSLLGISKSFAGGGGSVAGNGGDALVCANGEVIFFDIFEAEQGRGLKINLGPHTLTPYEKVELALLRLPPMLDEFRKHLENELEIFKSRHIVGKFDLVDIRDTENIITKTGCEIKQAVVQRKPPVPDDPIYYISEEYWNKMDSDSKAALILHEIIYHAAIQLGHKNSLVVRALNAYIMAEDLFMDKSCAISRVLYSRGLRSLLTRIQIGRLFIDGTQAVIAQDCTLLGGFVISGTVYVEGQKISPIYANNPKFANEWGADGISFKTPSIPRLIHFQENYLIKKGQYEFTLAGLRTSEWAGTEFWNAYRFEIAPPTERPGFILATADGRIDMASVAKMNFSLFGQNIPVTGEVTFSEDEVMKITFAPFGNVLLDHQNIAISEILLESVDKSVYQLRVAKDKSYTIKTREGLPVTINSDSRIYMYQDGVSVINYRRP